jgi:hypothetical protein
MTGMLSAGRWNSRASKCATQQQTAHDASGLEFAPYLAGAEGVAYSVVSVYTGPMKSPARGGAV